VRVTRFHHDGVELAVVSYPLGVANASLSAAEHEVVRLVLAGCSNAEIAAARGTKPRTVANQIASIFKKLGVGSRAELAALTERE
jgi:DNA-binding CsgD family transcriptional regulator